ncbi:MAG: flippase-like domain-containing protein [Candidatus Marsarchaeota archaeon]|nr:flippase-like domain-containing protein [Candidatus Marsarchaeota archaeon]
MAFDAVEDGVDVAGDYRRHVKKAEHTIFIILAASFAIFMIIALFAIANEGFRSFALEISSINVAYYAGAILILFGGYLLRFPKWGLYLNKLGVRIGRAKNLMIYLSMYSMDITPGRWGRSIASYTIGKVSNARFTKVFPAIVADIFTDFLGFASLALFASFLVNRFVFESVLFTILLLLPFFFLYNKGPFQYIKGKFGHIRWLRKFFKSGELYFRNKSLLGKGAYIYSLPFTITAEIMNGAALFLVILSFGVNLGLSDFPIVIFIYTSSLLIGLITGIPATLGVTDGALIGYLTLFFPALGITFGLASAITIFFRFISVWFVEGFGLASLVYTTRYWSTPSQSAR